MIALKIREQLNFDKDVSLIRAGGRKPTLYLNHGYDRMRVLNLATHEHHTLPFPESVDEFLIYSWIMAPDGERSFLFSSDPLDYALELEHERLVARKFSLPTDMPTLTNLCWMSPDVRMLDFKGGVWCVQGGAMIQPDIGAAEEELATFYRTLIQRYSICKIDYQANGFCAIDRDRNTFGLVSPGPGVVAMAPWSEDIIDVVHTRGNLFACREEGISLFLNGRDEPVLRPAPGRYFCAIEVVYVGTQGCLAVLSADSTGVARPGSFIDIYDLIPA